MFNCLSSFQLRDILWKNKHNYEPYMVIRIIFNYRFSSNATDILNTLIDFVTIECENFISLGTRFPKNGSI